MPSDSQAARSDAVPAENAGRHPALGRLRSALGRFGQPSTAFISLVVASATETVAVLPGCEPDAEALMHDRLALVLDETASPFGIAVGFGVTCRA